MREEERERKKELTTTSLLKSIKLTLHIQKSSPLPEVFGAVITVDRQGVPSQLVSRVKSTDQKTRWSEDPRGKQEEQETEKKKCTW